MEDKKIRFHEKFDIENINRMLEPHNLRLVYNCEHHKYEIMTEMEIKVVELEKLKCDLASMKATVANLSGAIPFVEEEIAKYEKELEEYGKNQEKR